VIGTALDPELQDEIRVTVVATGLNRTAARQPVRTEREREALIAPRAPMRVIRNATTGEVDYLDSPEGMPMNVRKSMPNEQAIASADTQVDYLDIPAFLRRQAD
jgi:cell division protein FtsZ